MFTELAILCVLLGDTVSCASSSEIAETFSTPEACLASVEKKVADLRNDPRPGAREFLKYPHILVGGCVYSVVPFSPKTLKQNDVEDIVETFSARETAKRVWVHGDKV